MILLEDDFPVPLPIWATLAHLGKWALKGSHPARKSTRPALLDGTFSDPCILFLSWWTLLPVNLSFIVRLIDWSINYNVIDFISGVSSGKFAAWLMFLFSLLSCAGSIYLGYILFYILHDTCVVCISMYVVNAFLLIINLINLKQVLAVAAVKKKKE